MLLYAGRYGGFNGSSETIFMPTVTSRRTTASLVAAGWIHSTSPEGKVKLHKKFVCMDSVPLASGVGVNTVARLVECSPPAVDVFLQQIAHLFDSALSFGEVGSFGL
eukprot:m.68593 g.68593  ORF g.68593 m.68593 type:complete len:107 (-) comp9930_c0_seq4:2110-2430(-)